MFNSLLSFLNGSSSLIPPIVGDANAQPQQPQPQAPQGPGFGDRLSAGLQGFLNSPSPMAALGNLVGGLSSGQRTDPAGVQGEAVRGMLNQLVATGRIDPTAARFLAANPSSWAELSKAMINVPIQIAPDGSIIQSRPFGQLNIPGGVPISDPAKRVNPDGSVSDAYNIRPSLTNPGGGSVVPGQAAQPRPQTGGPTPNPNLPNGGRPIISQQSPQAIQEQEGVGKDLAAQYADITKKAAAATSRLGTLNRLSQLSPGAYEGAGAPALQLVRSFLVTLGIPSEKVAAGEEFTALSNKMVLDANNGSLGTGVSNADVAFIKNMQPDISQTREGRQMIIETATRLAKRDQEIAKQAANYRRQNGSMDGFQVYIQEWAEKNPLFRDMPLPPQRNATSFDDRFGAATPAPARPGDPGTTIRSVDGQPTVRRFNPATGRIE